MSSNYSRGANFERRVKKHLEGRGFFVLRTAGSHSPVDLLAMRQGEIHLIQCALTRGSKTQKGLQSLIDLAVENACQATLIWNRDGHIVEEDLTPLC